MWDFNTFGILFHDLINFLNLDIEHDCNEKLSSRILEDATAELRLQNIFLAFTVVANGFTALECFEHTKFDLLIIENVILHLQQNWNRKIF